jgi:hypothetical protein
MWKRRRWNSKESKRRALSLTICINGLLRMGITKVCIYSRYKVDSLLIRLILDRTTAWSPDKSNQVLNRDMSLSVEHGPLSPASFVVAQVSSKPVGDGGPDPIPTRIDTSKMEESNQLTVDGRAMEDQDPLSEVSVPLDDVALHEEKEAAQEYIASPEATVESEIFDGVAGTQPFTGVPEGGPPVPLDDIGLHEEREALDSTYRSNPGIDAAQDSLASPSATVESGYLDGAAGTPPVPLDDIALRTEEEGLGINGSYTPTGTAPTSGASPTATSRFEDFDAAAVTPPLTDIPEEEDGNIAQGSGAGAPIPSDRLDQLVELALEIRAEQGGNGVGTTGVTMGDADKTLDTLSGVEGDVISGAYPQDGSTITDGEASPTHLMLLEYRSITI